MGDVHRVTSIPSALRPDTQIHRSAVYREIRSTPVKSIVVTATVP